MCAHIYVCVYFIYRLLFQSDKIESQESNNLLLSEFDISLLCERETTDVPSGKSCWRPCRCRLQVRT